MSEDELRPEEKRGPIAWMAKNPVAANIVMLILLVGGGLIVAPRVKQEVFPEVDLDLIVVNVAYPGASPEEVEQGVVLAIEEAVRGIDGVKEVRSAAYEGNAIVSIELLLGTDNDRALADVKSAVDRITSFPEDAERPIISIASNRQQVISLVLYGELDEGAMRELANRVRDELLDDPRITYADIYGVRPLEVSVEVPRDTLREYGLTLGEVSRAVASASIELPSGEIRTRGGDVLLRTSERRDRGQEFGDIVVLSRPDGSQVRLADIATVDDGFQDIVRKATFNGQRAVMVNAYRVGDEKPVEVADAVDEHVRRLEQTLPANVRVATWVDTSDMYQQRLDLLRRNGIFGLILVFLALGLFLEPRLAFWVTLGIPISFAGSLLFLPAADVSINMISLFAFIVTLGMVVDDAIVIGEAIHKLRSDGLSPLAAAIRGTREVAVPVTFSILTTVIAFLPMLFVPGVMGKFFRVIPIVVSAVLLVSLFEALFVLPAHLSHPMPRWLRVALWPLFRLMAVLRPEKVSHGLERFVRGIYAPILGAALRWRYLTIAGGIAVFLATLGLVASGRVPFTFFPKVEGDLIIAQLRMPVGTPSELTEAMTERLVQTARELADEGDGPSITRGIYADLGAAVSFDSGPEGIFTATGSSLSTVMVYLVESDRRAMTTTAFTDRWREAVGEIPGAESLTFEYSIGARPGAPIDIRLSHPDTRILEASAETLADELRHYSALRDIESGVVSGKEQLSFHLTALGRAHGLTELELARQVRDAFFGAEAVRQQRGRDELRVYVRLPDAERASLHDLESFVVRTPRGGEIPLAQAAEVERGRAYTVIRRTDGRREIAVTADIGATGNASEIMASATERELAALLETTPGLSHRIGGEQKEQAQTMGSLGTGFLMALVAMYGLLAIVFRSYAHPILVMTAIPFGIVGALWGHALLGLGLSIMSMMGIVALSGVVVNDSIVFVDAINEFRRQGMGLGEALSAAGTRRFRAILLTSLTTFVGLAPMILEPSVQARFLIPMAVSLAFGVLFATVITLFLVPASYHVLEDLRDALGWRESPVAVEPAPSPSDAHAEE